MPTGFGKIVKREVRIRTFEVELKHREPGDTTGESETLIATEQIKVPILRNNEWEKRWAILIVWNGFSQPHFQEQGINQAFIFEKGFKDLIIRLEINPFYDEKAEKLDAPKDEAFDEWLKEVKKRFKQLYNFEMDEWIEINRQQFEEEVECIH
jgi:hypothetical protein